MFEFIIGDVVAIKEDFITLENRGIGYKIFTSTNSMLKLELGMKQVMIYTYFNLRDDGVYLYGFTTEEEIEMFKLLQIVSKIGPKIALGILSTLSPNQIKLSILRKDLQTLMKAPGIGKKTAERLVLELKDRVDEDIDILDDKEETGELNTSNYNEVIDGLMSLGYTRIEIDKVLNKMNILNMDIGDIIREALKKLSRE